MTYGGSGASTSAGGPAAQTIDPNVRYQTIYPADGRIGVAEAGALMGLGRRQVYRVPTSFQAHGPDALVSKRRGNPSNRYHGAAFRKTILGIVRERYGDFGPTLAAEKLAELHGLAW